MYFNLSQIIVTKVIILLKKKLLNTLQKIEFCKKKSKMSLNPEDIVIAGISGRFPKSNNVEEFSKNLFGKFDMTEEFESGMRKTDANLPARYGKLPNMDKFDASFFSFMNKFAQQLDAQVRVVLEHSYEAIIDAGISPQTLIGSRTGVIVACSGSDSHLYANEGVSVVKKGFVVVT